MLRQTLWWRISAMLITAVSGILLVITATSYALEQLVTPEQSQIEKIELNVVDSEQYTGEENILVRGTWGNKPGEFGLVVPSGEGALEGPMSFAAGGTGEIYILDQVNSRIQVFGPDGNLRDVIPIEQRTAEAVAVDAAGDVYVCDLWVQREIALYRDGKLLQKENLSPSLSAPREVFAVGKDIFIEDDLTGRAYLVASEGRILSPSEQGKESRPGRFAKENAHYLCVSQEENQGVSILDNTGKKRAISIQSNEPAFLDSFWLDADGNAYLIYQMLKESPPDVLKSRFSVVKVNISSGKALQMDVPTGLFTPSRRPFVITEEGSIYQMQTSNEGLKVVRWTMPGGGGE